MTVYESFMKAKEMYGLPFVGVDKYGKKSLIKNIELASSHYKETYWRCIYIDEDGDRQSFEFREDAEIYEECKTGPKELWDVKNL